MSQDHKNKSISLFLENNKLIQNLELTELEKDSIFVIEDAYYQVVLDESSQYDRLGQNPIWGIASELRDRVHTYTSASYANYVMGNYLSGEVLSRTATESSIGLKYIMSQPETSGFASFIKTYIDKENERIRKWKNTASTLTGEQKDSHLMMANIRQEAIDNINKNEIWQNFNINIEGEIASWPNIFGLFKETGSEVDYRTIYAMMCSQVHSDAGDVINRVLARIVEILTNNKKYGETNILEERTFSLFMIQFGIRYFLDGLIAYTKRFELLNSKMKLIVMKEQVNDQLQSIAIRLDNIKKTKINDD